MAKNLVFRLVDLDLRAARSYLKTISGMSAEGAAGSPRVVLLALRLLLVQPATIKAHLLKESGGAS